MTPFIQLARLVVKLCAVLLFAGIWQSPVSAHTHAASGTISADIHIDPGDNPVAGRSNTINFLTGDSASQFRVSNCDCKLTIEISGKTIFNGSAMPIAGTQTLSSSVILPRRGVYRIELTGVPLATGAFAPFKLSYTLRVDRGHGLRAASPPVIVTYGLVGLAAASITWLVGRDIMYGRRKRT